MRCCKSAACWAAFLVCYCHWAHLDLCCNSGLHARPRRLTHILHEIPHLHSGAVAIIRRMTTGEGSAGSSAPAWRQSVAEFFRSHVGKTSADARCARAPRLLSSQSPFASSARPSLAAWRLPELPAAAPALHGLPSAARLNGIGLIHHDHLPISFISPPQLAIGRRAAACRCASASLDLSCPMWDDQSAAHLYELLLQLDGLCSELLQLLRNACDKLMADCKHTWNPHEPQHWLSPVVAG